MTTNKIALVTGGSRGLGKEMALSLATKGLDVVITYLNKKDKAQVVVTEIEKMGRKAIALSLNTAETNDFENFIPQLKKVLKDKFNTECFDYLVNNAGFGIYASFAETTEELFDALMNVHLKGVFFLTQKMLPLMLMVVAS